jgi:hypothetical protein
MIPPGIQDATTPSGKPVENPIPTALVTVCLISVSELLIQSVGVDEAALTVIAGLTTMVPVAFTVSQPPVSGILYLNVPDAVGVPLIVITFADHAADTPAGSPVAVLIPVAPVVACVIFVNAALIHNSGADEAAETVFEGVTVIVPVALKLSQPPVKGIL